jgi:AbrB family looped-hinge helix DNA binding protein
MVKLLGKPRQIDNRNRITIPHEVLRLLNLKPNDEVFFRLNDGKIIMGKALVKYELIDEIIANKKKVILTS